MIQKFLKTLKISLNLPLENGETFYFPLLKVRFKLYILLVLFIVSHLAIPARANESLRIAGMGGAFSAVQYPGASIFGNPAGLTNSRNNNLSMGLSTYNLEYNSLPVLEGEQSKANLSFGLRPSLYFSRNIGKIGISVGYIYDMNNRNTTLTVKETLAEYIVDERKFASETDAVLEYHLATESSPVISVGYPINPVLSFGISLRYTSQVIKEGVINNPMTLTAIHGEDVNRNDATKLLPAIIDNLDAGAAIDEFRSGENSQEEVIKDLGEKGFDVDLGIQTRLPLPGDIMVGFTINRIFQKQLADSRNSNIRLGIAISPKKWLSTAFDYGKYMYKDGTSINLGWEVNHNWEKWFKGGLIFRNGISREFSRNKISVGIGIILGRSYWDYALVKELNGESILKASHMISSTTRF
ncbi:hypothetical protein GF312_01635 [Candidatus Poribacteria bacterium]|nr:hypothetical protein [Candidatus Poribacteria bacterium]